MSDNNNDLPRDDQQPDPDYTEAAKSAASVGYENKITNITWQENESGKMVAAPIQNLTPIVKTANRITGGWPRQAGHQIFVREEDGVRIFLQTESGNIAGFEGWLRTRHGEQLEWSSKTGCTSMKVFAPELVRQNPSYSSLERWPHYPSCYPTAYYINPSVDPGDGSTLRQFIDLFNFQDMDELLAMLFVVTPSWGGPPGERPAWAFQSAEGGGRGSGKSTYPTMVADIYEEPPIIFTSDIKSDQITTRLLSKSAAGRRFVLFDNVKTRRLSSAALESLITAPTISGKQMYVGEGQCVNNYTVSFTVNGANFSQDLAQRVIQIHVTKPTYSGTWSRQVRKFIAENQLQIMGDIAHYYQRPVRELRTYSRWGAWEREVLSRLPVSDDELAQLQRLIAQRSAALDGDQETAQIFEDEVADMIKHQGLDLDGSYLVPTKALAEVLNEVVGEKYRPLQSASRHVRQLVEEGLVTKLALCKSRKKGRCYTWQPRPDVTPSDELLVRLNRGHF